MFRRGLILTMVTATIFTCLGCKGKISDADVIGKWVHEYDEFEEKTRPRDINEAVIEFFADKTFKTMGMPIDVGDMNRTIEFCSGSGKWEIDGDRDDDVALLLHFARPREGGCRRDMEAIAINQAFGKIITLYYECGPHANLCIFNKVEER